MQSALRNCLRSNKHRHALLSIACQSSKASVTTVSSTRRRDPSSSTSSTSRLSVVHLHHLRKLSSSASLASSSKNGNAPQVPEEEQPATSPDRTEEPLEHPAGGEAADLAAGEAAKTEEQATSSADGQVQMTEQEKEILGKLEKAFPGGTVAVQDVSGGCGTFFAISIASDSFKGLSKIKQHQKVNKILQDEVKTWHGMQLKTMPAN